MHARTPASPLACAQCERDARYSEYVAKQPFTNPDVLDGAFKRRIYTRVGRGDITQRLAKQANGAQLQRRAGAWGSAPLHASCMLRHPPPPPPTLPLTHTHTTAGNDFNPLYTLRPL